MEIFLQRQQDIVSNAQEGTNNLAAVIAILEAEVAARECCSKQRNIWICRLQLGLSLTCGFPSQSYYRDKFLSSPDILSLDAIIMNKVLTNIVLFSKFVHVWFPSYYKSCVATNVCNVKANNNRAMY